MQHSRRGFTLIEFLIAVAALTLIAAVALPQVTRQIQGQRLGRAAVTVAGDLESAFVIAARQRKPVRLSLSGGTYTVADRTGGTVRLRRALTAEEEYAITTVAFSTTPVDIFPTGIASAADTVTISNAGGSRKIVMSVAGQVRVLR